VGHWLSCCCSAECSWRFQVQVQRPNQKEAWVFSHEILSQCLCPTWWRLWGAAILISYLLHLVLYYFFPNLSCCCSGLLCLYVETVVKINFISFKESMWQWCDTNWILELGCVWKFVREVLRLFNKSLECGDDNIDPILRDVIIQFSYKKGVKSDCNNIWTLSLISHIGKVLERMIRSRVHTTAETLGWLPETQNGFRGSRSRKSLW